MFAYTVTFLEALFAPCEQGFLTFTAIHPAGHRPTPSRHVPLSDKARLASTLERLTEANRQGWGTYVAVAPRRTDLGRWRRGGKGDVLALPALFADIDRPPETVLPILRSFRPLPSCIVASGRGVHVYWFLSTPTRDLAVAERALHGLARALHGDRLSVAQSMRLVGSRNIKPQAGGVLCELIALHPHRRYALDAFARYIPPPRTTSRPRVHDTTPTMLNPRVVRALAEHLLARGFRLRGTWLNGPCVHPERHAHGDARPSFGYNTASGYGYCHVCGTLLTRDLCRALGIEPRALGGLLSSMHDTKRGEFCGL